MTKSHPSIALVGATGLIGQEWIRQLDSLSQDVQVRLIASEDSKGELREVAGNECEVETLDENSFKEVDIVLIAAPKEVSERALRYAIDAKCFVIDSTQPKATASKFPKDSYQKGEHIILPDPVTSLLAPLVAALQSQGITSLNVSTYQAVSGAGRAGLDELWNQTLAVFNQKEVEQEAFEHQISFNCIPQIDLLSEDGNSRMESRVKEQLAQQFLPAKPDIMITGVRVPCLFGISATVTASVTAYDAKKFLEVLDVISVQLHTDPADVITPLQTIGDDSVHVSRIRSSGALLSFWCTADNIQTCLVSQGMRVLKQLLKS